MTATISPPMFTQFFSPNNTGAPASGYKLFTYAAGTSTKQATWSDSTQAVQNPNPIILDASGGAYVWGDPTLPYKFVWALPTDTDPPTSPIRTVDNLYFPLTVGLLTQALLGLLLYPRTAGESAASVTPVFYQYPPGDIRRYGASSTNADNGGAVNDALRSNSVVFDGETSGPTIYPVQTTIRFRCSGQTLRGAGFGDVNASIAPGTKFAARTTFKWTGATNGKVVSVSDGTINWSETILQNLCIDGNSLANKGVEGYDDAIVGANGGCWRNVYKEVTVLNCSAGSSPTAIYLGDNPSFFSNDAYLENCYLWSSGIGVFVIGAVPQLHHCTIGECTTGLYMPGNGAEVKIYGGVFHSNTVDIDVGALGVIQNLSVTGTWFENSTAGIFVAHNSYNAQFIGCHLHTSFATCLMNLNGVSGHLVVKSWVPSGSASFSLINPNPAYDYDLIGTGIVIQGNYKLKIKGPAGLADIDNAKFQAFLTNSTAAVTGDGTQFNLNASGVTKDYDLSSAVSANGVFTAPCSGIYQFNISLALNGVTGAHNDAQLLMIVTGTSAGTYVVDRRNPGTQLLAGGAEMHISGTLCVPMTLGDTGYPAITVSGAGKAVSVMSGGPVNNYRTLLVGQLS